MLFDKKKHIIKIKGSSGQFNTEKMRGLLQHLIVQPSKNDTSWRLRIVDKSADEIYDRTHTGRLDDKEGLALGTDTQAKLTVLISNLSQSDTFKIIFFIKEIH